MSLPRMSFHIGDYRKDTGHLRAAEHGAYLLLIMHYWTKGGLPDDDRQLAAIACMSDREWKQARPILQAFFQEGWKHKRVEQELVVAQEKYERRSRAGVSGADARWHCHANANGNANSNRNASAMANRKQPITDNQIIESRARARRAKVPLPDNFVPDREPARSLGWTESKIDQEIERFQNSARAHDRKYADWGAAWRNWLTSPLQKEAKEKAKQPGREGWV